MPTREEITYILVDDQIAHHDKIEPLSDAAFRRLIDGWCWCSANHKDGVMPLSVWKGMATEAVRTQLSDAGMVTAKGARHVEFHDYLDIQRSQAEIAAVKKKRSDASKIANHRRHHVNRNISVPECDLCLKAV